VSPSLGRARGRGLSIVRGTPMTDLSAAWTALQADAAAARGRSILSLYDAEPDRLARLTIEAAGLTLDLSQQPWSKAGVVAALDLARAAGVEQKRADLFAGAAINSSENRAVLHPALRAPAGGTFSAMGEPVSGEVEAVRCQIKAFADGVAAGTV